MQVHDIEVPLPDRFTFDEAGVRAINVAFDEAYEALFGAGSGYRQGGIEITSLSLRATAELAPVEFAETLEPKGMSRSSRPVYWTEYGEFVDTQVVTIASGALADEIFSGPFLIEFPDTVVVVPPGMKARFDEQANVVIESARLARP